MESLLEIAAVLVLVWCFFTGFVFVDQWRQIRRIADATNRLAEAVRSLHQTAHETRVNTQRMAVIAKQEYMRARGHDEDPEEVRRAFLA